MLDGQWGVIIAPAFSTANVPGMPDGRWRGTVTDYTHGGMGKSIEWIREKARLKCPFSLTVRRRLSTWLRCIQPCDICAARSRQRRAMNLNPRRGIALRGMHLART